nr:hypothetical protein [Tanacetum cinerariifolium]
MILIKEKMMNFSESVNAQLKAEVLTRSSHSSRTSYAVAADLSEMELKKILIEKIEGNKSIQRSDEQRNLYKALVEAYEADKIILDTYGETVTLKRRRDDESDKDEGPSAGLDRGSKRRIEGAGDQPIVQSSQHSDWFSQPKKPPTPDHDWNKTLPAVQGSTQTWISELAKQADSRSSFNEILDTPLDFSNFIMHQLTVDTLTPKLLAGPTYKLMKGSCQQYPHNLLQPLPLIPDNRCRRVIPFAHFINNDLEYLRGGASSHKYTTSEPINFDKHAFWGVSHWGRKRQQFYGFTVNRESALDVYSKRRIIADKKNRLIRIDELHKFNDGTLNDVRNALDDCLKGIRMHYLPQTIWRKGDKDIAAAMIQAIDKMLKTRRIMRSLERFVGGRL